MKSFKTSIISLQRRHVRACETIVAASDPWKRLNERVDFRSVLTSRVTGMRGAVFMAGQETAGFVLFIPLPVFARGGYLKTIGVAPKFLRQGIGRKLLSFAEKSAARRCRYLFLCVSDFNRHAQKFYQRCGYSRVGRLPNLIRSGTSEYVYWKRLQAK